MCVRVRACLFKYTQKVKLDPEASVAPFANKRDTGNHILRRACVVK